jgi:surfactin synthase thioesterase subunit
VFPARRRLGRRLSRLGAAITPDTAVFAVQYPGRQDRLGEPLITDLRELANRIYPELAVGAPRLALFGHSMGATVAFETARRLEKDGQQVIRLFVSGRIAPDATYDGAIHHAPDEEVIAELERLANDPASVAMLRSEPSLAELVLPAVRADYQAVETYRFEPGPALRCDISALLGDADPTVTAEQAGEWARHTDGTFDLATFPGRHFYLDEKVSAVAEFVNERSA